MSDLIALLHPAQWLVVGVAIAALGWVNRDWLRSKLPMLTPKAKTPGLSDLESLLLQVIAWGDAHGIEYRKDSEEMLSAAVKVSIPKREAT